MGINYTCYPIVGAKYSKDDREVIQESIFERKPVYDTRTGEVARHEWVLVKEEVANYSFLGVESDCFGQLYEDLCDKYHKENMEVIIDNGEIYVGNLLVQLEDYGRVDLPEGDASLKNIIDLFDNTRNKLGLEPQLYFVNIIE